MKSLLLFIFFLGVGFTVVMGYSYWNKKNSIQTRPPAETSQFSIINAPTESLKGTITSISGTVNWLSRTAKKPVQLKKPRSIQQGEEIGTGNNGKAEIVIQDTIFIFLSQNSHINFIQTLPTDIVISQSEGRVAYVNDGIHAVSVRTLNVVTEVDRGWATIALDKDVGTVTVTVQKGSVTEGFEDGENTSNVVTVNEGKQFTFDDTTKVGTIQ